MKWFKENWAHVGGVLCALGLVFFAIYVPLTCYEPKQSPPPFATPEYTEFDIADTPGKLYVVSVEFRNREQAMALHLWLNDLAGGKE